MPHKSICWSVKIGLHYFILQYIVIGSSQTLCMRCFHTHVGIGGRPATQKYFSHGLIIVRKNRGTATWHTLFSHLPLSILALAVGNTKTLSQRLNH